MQSFREVKDSKGAKTDWRSYKLVGLDHNGEISYPPFSTRKHFVNIDDLRLSLALATLLRGINDQDYQFHHERDPQWHRIFLDNQSRFRDWFHKNGDQIYFEKPLVDWVELFTHTEAYKKAYRKAVGIRE